MIAALFVQKNGSYYGLDNVDPWDETRDARLYSGPYSVVAHPPCSTWCQLARLNESRYGIKVGSDSGCFKSALESVNKYGGVLEHLAYSIAWDHFWIIKPTKSGWNRTIYGYYVCEVYQRNYGHLANKKTWLYYVGGKEPENAIFGVPNGKPSHVVSYLSTGDKRPRISKKEASKTTVAFRDYLIRLAENCRLK
jgi:hypothetical protein